MYVQIHVFELYFFFGFCKIKRKQLKILFYFIEKNNEVNIPKSNCQTTSLLFHIFLGFLENSLYQKNSNPFVPFLK